MINISQKNKAIQKDLTKLFFIYKDIQIKRMQIDTNTELNNTLRVKELKKELNYLKENYTKEEKRLEEIFNYITDDKSKTILKLKYISLLNWKDIEKVSSFSLSYVYSLHNSGLTEVKKIIDKKNKA